MTPATPTSAASAPLPNYEIREVLPTGPVTTYATKTPAHASAWLVAHGAYRNLMAGFSAKTEIYLQLEDGTTLYVGSRELDQWIEEHSQPTIEPAGQSVSLWENGFAGSTLRMDGASSRDIADFLVVHGGDGSNYVTMDGGYYLVVHTEKGQSVFTEGEASYWEWIRQNQTPGFKKPPHRYTVSYGPCELPLFSSTEPGLVAAFVLTQANRGSKRAHDGRSLYLGLYGSSIVHQIMPEFWRWVEEHAPTSQVPG